MSLFVSKNCIFWNKYIFLHFLRWWRKFFLIYPIGFTVFFWTLFSWTAHLLYHIVLSLSRLFLNFFKNFFSSFYLKVFVVLVEILSFLTSFSVTAYLLYHFVFFLSRLFLIFFQIFLKSFVWKRLILCCFAFFGSSKTASLNSLSASLFLSSRRVLIYNIKFFGFCQRLFWNFFVFSHKYNFLFVLLFFWFILFNYLSSFQYWLAFAALKFLYPIVLYSDKILCIPP